MDESVQAAMDKLKEFREPQETIEVVDAETEQEINEAASNGAIDIEESTETEEAEEAETVAESDETGADDGAERVELEADQFAELLGIKPDLLDINDEGKVVFKAKVGEAIEDVNLDRLINAFQGDANLTNRSKALAEQEKAKQAELANFQQTIQSFAQQSSAMLEGLSQQILKPFESVNWAELKEEDPGQYAALKQDQREAEGLVSKLANDALTRIQEAQNTQKQELHTQYQSYLNTQKAIITERIPDFDKKATDIEGYMKQIGFAEQEISQIADARLIESLYKAMMFDKGKKGAEQKIKKTMPKILKPGKSPTKTELSNSELKKQMSRLKESGDPEDAVRLLRMMR